MFKKHTKCIVTPGGQYLKMRVYSDCGIWCKNPEKMDEGEADLEESLPAYPQSSRRRNSMCFLVTRRFTKHKNGPVNRVVCLALFFYHRIFSTKYPLSSQPWPRKMPFLCLFTHKVASKDFFQRNDVSHVAKPSSNLLFRKIYAQIIMQMALNLS